MKHKKLISLTIASILTLSFGLQAAQGGKGGKQPSAERILAHLDSNEDSVISLAEFMAPKLTRAESKFAYIDTDEDGFISLQDIEDAREEKPKNENREAIRQCVADSLGIDFPERLSIEEHFTQADANADSFLDWTEFSLGKINRNTIKFNKIDSDANGEINLEELSVAVEKRKSLYQIRRDCRDEVKLMNEIVEG